MTAVHQAQRAYGGPASPVRTPRQAEHQVLSGVTARLAAALASGALPPLAAALHDNRRLWTRLAADVADGDNGLPQDLRARIFWLAEFTHAHTGRVLSGEAEAGVLVEINAAVLRGLGAAPARVAP